MEKKQAAQAAQIYQQNFPFLFFFLRFRSPKVLVFSLRSSAALGTAGERPENGPECQQVSSSNPVLWHETAVCSRAVFRLILVKPTVGVTKGQRWGVREVRICGDSPLILKKGHGRWRMSKSPRKGSLPA